VAACRELFGDPAVLSVHTSRPLRHPVAAALGWSLLLPLVFVPLSVWRYQSAGRLAAAACRVARIPRPSTGSQRPLELVFGWR